MSDERDDALRPPDEPGGDGGGEELDPTDLVGDTLAGRYKVLKRLGVGAMGAVYLGEHMRIGRKDAIKVLRSSMARDPEAIARFTRGARNVSRIRHPNVCTLYDFGNTEEGFHFLAMEYVDGPTLGSLLEQQGALSPERAADLIGQVGEALYAAHSHGIVHRDLKPDNIMVARERDGSERVKVVDFDIARGPAEEEGPAVTRHGFVVGTPEYMSPEQLTGDPLDGRSDIYSMALVLFRMLTDRLPFEGQTAQEIMVQRLTRDPMSLADTGGGPFPHALEAAVAEGLRRKASERPATAREFARKVARAVDAEGPLAEPAPSASGAASPPAPLSPPPTIAPSASATGGFEPPVPVGGAGPDGGSPDPATGTRVSPEATESTGSRTRLMMVLGGLAAVMVLFLGGGLLVASLWFGWIGGGDEAGLAQAPDDPPGEVADLELPDPDVPLPTDDDEGEEQEVAEQGDQEAVVPPPVTDPPLTAGDEEAEAEVVPTPAEETPPALVLDILPGDARNLVYQQLLASDPGDLPESPDARRFALEAIRDTVDAVWRMDGLSREDQAFAAYVLGQTLSALGSPSEALQWLEEAVRLDPIERYIEARDAMREGDL